MLKMICNISLYNVFLLYIDSIPHIRYTKVKKIYNQLILQIKGMLFMKKLLAVLSFSLTILFTACSSGPQVESGVSVYNPYPELQNPAIGYFQDAPVERQIKEGKASALLITVKEVLPSFEKESDPDWFGGEALLEEKGVSDLPGIPYQPYLIEIEQF